MTSSTISRLIDIRRISLRNFQSASTSLLKYRKSMSGGLGWTRVLLTSTCTRLVISQAAVVFVGWCEQLKDAIQSMPGANFAPPRPPLPTGQWSATARHHRAALYVDRSTTDIEILIKRATHVTWRLRTVGGRARCVTPWRAARRQ